MQSGDDGVARKSCRAAKENNDAGASVLASGAAFLPLVETETAKYFLHTNVTAQH
jgi:hypothetical protein